MLLSKIRICRSEIYGLYTISIRYAKNIVWHLSLIFQRVKETIYDIYDVFHPYTAIGIFF